MHNISCFSLSEFYGLLQPCDVTGAHRIISIAREAQKTKHSENERNIMACLAIFSPAFSTERLSKFKTLRLNTYIIQRIRFLDHNFFGIQITNYYFSPLKLDFLGFQSFLTSAQTPRGKTNILLTKVRFFSMIYFKCVKKVRKF